MKHNYCRGGSWCCVCLLETLGEDWPLHREGILTSDIILNLAGPGADKSDVVWTIHQVSTPRSPWLRNLACIPRLLTSTPAHPWHDPCSLYWLEFILYNEESLLQMVLRLANILCSSELQQMRPTGSLLASSAPGWSPCCQAVARGATSSWSRTQSCREALLL